MKHEYIHGKNKIPLRKAAARHQVQTAHQTIHQRRMMKAPAQQTIQEAASVRQCAWHSLNRPA